MSTVMGMQNFIKIYQKVKGIWPVSLFSEFERQNLDLTQISFDNLIGYILSISMCMQNSITIFFTVLEIGSFSLFQNLELGKASTDKNDSSQFLGLDLVNIPMCMQNVITIFHLVQEIGPVSLFQNLELGKTSTDENYISQSLGLDLDNINVYADVYQNIPLSSRDKAIFTFLEFGARQSLDR